MTNKILKVFADGKAQATLSAAYDMIESYESFVLLSVPEAAVKKISTNYLLEDITEEYAIRINGTELLAASSKAKKSTARGRANKIAAPSDGFHHFIVQFIGPIKEEWLAGVTKAGGQMREPLSGFVYIVRAKQAAATKISELPFVRYVAHYSHEDRIAESVKTQVTGRKSGDGNKLPRQRVLDDTLTIAFFGAKEARLAKKAIADTNAELLSSDIDAALLTVQLKGTPRQQAKQLAALSALHGVRRIREKTIKRTSNDVAATVLKTALTSASGPGLGLSGAGEIIAVCDTGLDTGDAATIHDDFQGRVVAIQSYPIGPDLDTFINNPRADDGPADVDSGHGTHVAGSVLGDGAAAATIAGAPAIRGLSHKAKLVFQAVEQEAKWKSIANERRYGRFGLWGLPDDLTSLFEYAYDKGARIHSNSWGGGDAGAYDNQCRLVDQFIWDHKDFCILFAAGNDGTDADADGQINPGSVTSPGTAKNCITVGACENLRPNFSNQKYGVWWPQDFPAAPIANDPMADDANQVVAFSSRGPTLDNRFKPDVVAPGTFILSTRSTRLAQNNFAWAAFPASKKYFHMGGTSMATPLAAGAVGLIREFLRKKKQIANPTAALLKASLIAGTDRLPNQSSAGSVVDNHQGFGRINLDSVLAVKAPASSQFIEVAPGLSTGQSWNSTVKVKANRANLRVVLAYSDFPGSNLVNNLNLIVTSPTGKLLAGNQAAGTTATPDTKNNVEVVNVKSPAAGKWKIQVVASSIPKGPQDFALVVLS